MSETVDKLLTVKVWCSATRCRFKRNNGYYNLCHNPAVLREYIEFSGGNVHVEGCGAGCATCTCTADGCELSKYAVSDDSGDNSESIPKVSDDTVIQLT